MNFDEKEFDRIKKCIEMALVAYGNGQYIDELEDLAAKFRGNEFHRPTVRELNHCYCSVVCVRDMLRDTCNSTVAAYTQGLITEIEYLEGLAIKLEHALKIMKDNVNEDIS